MDKQKVMIAGIGGASLGTEICKALRLSRRYEVYGCDISPTAYGMYDSAFTATYKVDREHYLETVLEACFRAGVNWLLPGGEQPMILLEQARAQLTAAGISLVGNSPEVVALCSDKHLTFVHLESVGVVVPRTAAITEPADLASIGLPCIVKPSTASGGSVSVFYAVAEDEAMVYADFIRRNGGLPIAQQYVDDREGEFTIGVLSLPDGSVASSIALRRNLDAKLSVAFRGRGGIISSGYSQGYIDLYPDLCLQAEKIAYAVGSRGPINVQGRVRDGVLLPFEINPRFSASTYLRALAGRNEVDMFIDHLLTGKRPDQVAIKPGWYLRSLTEQFVATERLK